MLPRTWSVHTLRDTNFAPGPMFLHACSWSQRAAVNRSTTVASTFLCALVTWVWLDGVPVTGGPSFAAPHANSNPIVVSESPYIVLRRFMPAQPKHLPFRVAAYASLQRRVIMIGDSHVIPACVGSFGRP